MLVPNLDEIMVEIRAGTKETVAELVEKVPEKEPQRMSGEEEEEEEEEEVGNEIKRKKGEEEEEEHSSGREDEDLLSKEGFELMQKT